MRGIPYACDTTVRPRRSYPRVNLAKLIESWRRMGRQLLRRFTVTLRTAHHRRRGQPCCQYMAITEGYAFHQALLICFV